MKYYFLLNQQRQWLLQRVASWLHHPQEGIEKLDSHNRSQAKQYVVELGTATQATIRINDLQETARQRRSTTFEGVSKVTAIVFNAVFGTAAVTILATSTNRGAFSLVGGAVGGALSGCITEQIAGKVITQQRRRLSTKAALKAHNERCESNPPMNELGEAYHRAQKDLLLSLESHNMQQHFAGDLVGPVASSGFECAFTFWLVLPAGPTLAVLAASFPTILNWLIALFESAYFDFPKYCEEMVESYEAYLPSQDVSEPEGYEIQYLDTHLEALAQGDLTGQDKNLGMRLATWKKGFGQNKIRWLEQQYNNEANQLREQHQKADKELLETPKPKAQASIPTEDVSGRQDRLNWEHQKWVQEERRKLFAEFNEKLEQLKAKYLPEAQKWQNFVEQAERDRQAAYEHWLHENGYTDNDLRNAA